jgi:simple sugar transport system permease protein
MTAVTKHRLFWPAAVLAVLLLSNLLFTPGFFNVEIRDGHLYGSLIDVFRLSAPMILIALGMTMVIATGGIDLSVGSVVAISGALACLRISELSDQNSLVGVLAAVGLALLLCVALGLWNGFLVAGIGMQPIVATLILMVAGRGLAQLITGGQIITINSDPYKFVAGGHILGIPFPIILAFAVTGLAALLVRRSALGMLIESVGGNAEASRLAGIRSRRIVLMVYVFAALCAGIAGLIVSSDVSGADGNNAGLWFELDAILAVVIGGTLLAGGRFSIAGSVIGVLIIQTLTTMIYTIGVTPEARLTVKAVVVIIVCLIQSPAFRAKVFRRRRPPTVATSGPASPEKPGPASPEKVEVPA